MAAQRWAAEEGRLPGDVVREIERLERADLVIFQFPLWWHGPPAALKGWMDRVFVYGKLFTSTMRFSKGYFKGKRALVSVTTGADAETFGPGSRSGEMDVMLWPVQFSFHYMGWRVLEPFIAHGVRGAGYGAGDDDPRRDHLTGLLDQWQACLQDLDGRACLDFPDWDDWDANGQPGPLG